MGIKRFSKNFLHSRKVIPAEHSFDQMRSKKLTLTNRKSMYTSKKPKIYQRKGTCYKMLSLIVKKYKNTAIRELCCLYLILEIENGNLHGNFHYFVHV